MSIRYFPPPSSGNSNNPSIPMYNILTTGVSLTIPTIQNWYMSRRFTMQGTAQLIVHGAIADIHCGASFTKA